MGRSSHSPTPADKAEPALLAPPIIDVSALRRDGFVRAVRAYQAAALATAHGVLQALATTLGVPGFFATRMSEPQCRLRFLHYAPRARLLDGSAPVFSTPHTDYGAITLLAVDGLPGLEVLHHGRWTPVAAPAGSLIVQLGDIQARWTNDCYRSTPHRVVASFDAGEFLVSRIDSPTEPYI